MAAPIVIPVQVEEQGAIRDLDNVERGISGLGRASSRASVGTTRLSTATRGLTARTTAARSSLGAASLAVSELGTGLGALSPKTAELATQFGNAGSSAALMGAAMGPVGVAIGLASAALPLLISELVSMSSEAESTATSMDDLTLSLDETISKINELDRIRSRQAAIAAGVGEAEPLRALAQQQQQRLRGQTQTLEASLEAAGISGPLAQRIAGSADRQSAQRRLRAALLEERELGQLPALSLALEQVADQRDRASAATREATQAQLEANDSIVQEIEFRRQAEEQDEAARRRESGRRRGRRGRRGRGGPEGDDALNEDEFALQQLTKASELAAIAKQDAAMAAAEQLEFESQIAEKLKDQIASARFLAELERETARIAQEEAQRREATAALQIETNQKVAGLFSTGVEAGLEIFKANEGQKELFRGFSQIAQAFGAYPDVFGIAQHGIAAGLHFVNAGRMGVSGGGESPPTAEAARTGAEGFGGGGGEGGGGVTVINYNAAVPEALIGREQRRASRAFEARFGKG